MKCEVCLNYAHGQKDGHGKITLCGVHKVEEFRACKPCKKEYEIRMEERDRVFEQVKKYINGYMAPYVVQKYVIKIREALNDEDIAGIKERQKGEIN